ncbi:Casein kinase substrate phosphoprotein PP28 [Venturia nashicola]|uniref:Mediator of RNA polymerase II transcription subunit 11 n=1 Tax=Venturia nashicola TaxID=86259 RepID=A0A4Z1NTX7_9PEZI|nr:Casein kinase substrate phosphoprotein PP28 [Venturia nashicola]TLD20213.1 Casein kinase substrate phosphoprotein PP28 [Venturia nashicola]
MDSSEKPVGNETMKDDERPPTTAAANIKELSAISKQIPIALQAAGAAISVLTNNPTPGLLSSKSKKAREDAFSEQDANFTRALHKIGEDLMWQVDVLLEAGLLIEKTPKVKPGREEVTNGGLGTLDVGYLNSRAKDVGLVKEGELIAEARKLAEKVVNGKEGDAEGGDAMEE